MKKEKKDSPTCYKLAGICIFLIVLTIAVYWGVHTYSYIHLDDVDALVKNPYVTNGLSIRAIKWAFTTKEYFGYWMPLSWLSFILDVQFFGVNPGASHLINLLFHLLNVLLLFFLLKTITGLSWHSAVVASLFAIHPIHVESVAWISERKDVLSAFFWLVTMLMYIRYTRKRDSTLYLLMAVSFILGLTAKPMLVTLPFALLILDFWPLKRFTLDIPTGLKSREFIHCIKEKLPLFVLSIIFVVINLANVKAEQTSPLTVLSFPARMANALVSYCAYLGKLFFPVNLSILYPHSFPDPIPFWKIVGATLLLIALTIAAVKLIKRAPYFLTGWLWYLGILVPVIGLTQTGTQAIADRFLYVPAIGIYVILVWGLTDLFAAIKVKSAATITLVTLVLITLFVMTRNQHALYRSSIPIFKHTLSHTKNNHLIHNNLGLVLYEQGKYNRAFTHFKKAVTINPKNEFAWNNLGTWYANKDSLKSAIYCFGQAIEIRPDYSSVYFNLGSIYERLHIDSFAIVFYENHLKYRPDYLPTLKSLGNIYIAQNSPDRAILLLVKALKMEPKSSTIHNALGMAYERKGDPNRAMKHYITAIELDPSAWQTYNNFGLLLLNQKDIFNAAKSFSEAIKLKPRSEMPYLNRGRAYLAANMAPYAKNDFLSALKINPNSIPAHSFLGDVYTTLGIADSAAMHQGLSERLKEKYK